MATLDTLIIKLLLDTSDFKKGSKDTQEALKKTQEESDRHLKEMEARAKATAAAYSKVKSEILGMLGVTLTASGAARFVEKITQGDAAVGRLAKNLGLATTNLSAWEGMAEKFGGSASDMDSAFRNAFKIVQDIKARGNSDALGPLSFFFARAGMSDGLAQFTKLAQSGQIEEMLKLVQKATTMSKDKGLALSLLGQAGFSEQTFTVFSEVNDQLERQLAIQQKLNVVNERDAEIAKHRISAWRLMQDALVNTGRGIINGKESLSSIFSIKSQVDSWKLFGRLVGNLFSTGQASEPGQVSASRRSSGTVTEPGDWLTSLEVKWGLPNGLLKEVIRQEGWKGKDSPKGAQGPMQFMPGTGAAYGLDTREKRENYVLATSAGAQLLHDLLAQYGGDLQSALRAYNGGARGVAGRLPESVNYANSIMGRMSQGGSTTEVNIGQVTINTNATDAKGIAKDFSAGVRDSYSLAAQAGVGVQ